MANTNKKDFVDYDEPVVADEMQKTVSFELEHKSLRLWYVLNSLSMIFTMFIFVGTEDPSWAIPPSIQIMLLVQYGIMYFCLSLYHLRAADKGVLDSFSSFQKGGKGLMDLLGFMNLYIPASPIISHLFGKGDDTYLTFFAVWCGMAWLYYIINVYSVKLNQKVRDGIAADGENEEE
ncbi:MAG: hypothetical protein NC395_05600 [Prevotella sp.]|nr:hypothetical protein [Prevotella sp.]